MMTFDDLFDKSDLPYILKQAKTLSKEECRGIYDYMDRKRPKTILEFGTQYGCSTRVFLEMSKWLGLNICLHSWDIEDSVRRSCIDKKDFFFHLENITGKESVVFKKYDPDLFFLDAHVYSMTKKIIQMCLIEKIDFMCHDVSMKIYERARTRSKNFTDYSVNTGAEWELYILQELISKDILCKDYFENNTLKINCIRDKFGLSIVEHK